MDSAVAAACAVAEGRTVHALSLDYGQRCQAELAAAGALIEPLGLASHRIIRADLRAIGGSSLTTDEAVPTHRDESAIGSGIPSTYVPARNTVMLSFALGLAEVLGAEELVIGANALDYSGYPDCRGPYLRAFENLATLATAAGVEGRARYRVWAPLLELSKAEIVTRGVELGVPLAATMSCYDPPESPEGDRRACGGCDSCALRSKGFRESGVPDPTVYAGAVA